MPTEERPKRVLLTGGDGFVAPHAVNAIRNLLPDARILLTARRSIQVAENCEFSFLDIRDPTNVRKLVSSFMPTHILHLAGIASRSVAELDVVNTWATNLAATVDLARQCRERCKGAVFLFVSSSQVYFQDPESPLSEDSPLAPVGAYASTKLAAEAALAEMAASNFQVLTFRPFNHTGPGQAPEYAFGSFVRQVVRIEREEQAPRLITGNLEVERDIIDVRDVARAYALAIAKSGEMRPLETLNLAGGVPMRLATMVQELRAAASKNFEIVTDPALTRQGEPNRVLGDASRASKLLGWKVEIPIAATIRDMLNAARVNASL